VRRGDLVGRVDVAFNNPFNIRKPNTRYECLEISKITKSVSGGTPSKSNPEYWNGDIPWVSPKDFKDFYAYDSEDHISNEGLKASGLKLIPADTVLVVVRSGILIHTLPVMVTKKSWLSRKFR
jgi:hypothetical protein